jgi:hypothetical protein
LGGGDDDDVEIRWLVGGDGDAARFATTKASHIQSEP